MRVHRFALATLATIVVSLALASTASADLGRVVAIGDSLAAGTMLGPQVPGSILACGQTTGSYPELAMARVKHGTWVDATCNGGHSGVFSNSWGGLPQDPPNHQYNDGTTIPPQYNSLNGTESAVIVGAGGNEAYYGDSIFTCLGHSEDYNLDKCTNVFGADGAGLRTRTAGSKTLIAGVLDTIHQKSPNAKIFLVGTPRIAPPDGAGCWPNPILTLADAPVWAVWEDSLRQAMMEDVAARSSYASFVDVQAASGMSHTMCAASNMKWMNPWTTENVQYPGLALHNTPWGADAIADIIINSMKAAGLSTGTPNAPSLTRTTTTASPTQTFTYSGTSGYSFKCRLDNAPYTACPSSPVTLTGLTSGPHTYSVTQTDLANNVSPGSIVNFSVDTTPPGIPVATRTAPTASPTNSPTQTFTYSGAETGGTFQCKLDSDAYAPCPASPATISGLTTSPHTYYVTQTDAAGNVSPAKTLTWTVDVTPPGAPNVNRTSPSANPTSSTTQVITYSGAEAGGTFQCKLDSALAAPCPGSPVTLTGLTPGSHTYSVTQTDAVGNVGSATAVTWLVDNTPPGAPTVTRTIPSTTPTNSPTQVITYSGAEAGGTFQCKLDSAAAGPCLSSPVTLNALGSGSHVYLVTQTDAAGNVSPAGSASWTVDVTPPPVPSVSGVSGTTALNSASITYSDSEAGVTFKCKLDSAIYDDCLASPVSLSGLANGPHTYSVTATDATGNTSSAGAASWTVDPNGFIVSLSSAPNNPSTVRTASFDFAALNAPGTTYECKIDSGGFSGCSAPKTYGSLIDGPHVFTVHGINGAQTTPDVTHTWLVDATPPGAPTLIRTTPSTSPTNSTSQTFSLAAAEAGGVLSCKLDSAPAETCPSSPITVTALGNGSHTYTVTQTDAAGNTGSAATATWLVDTTKPSAPTVTRTNPTAVLTNLTTQTITYGGLEAGASTQCKLDTGSFGPCSASGFTLPGLGEGSHTFSITQTDTAGNTSDAGSVSWTVDSIAPGTPTLLRDSPTATPTNSPSQTLSFSGAEAGGTLKCKLDGGGYSTCASSPVTLPSLSNGSHTYSVTQTDATGNTSPVASVTWLVDLIAPTTGTIDFSRPAVTNADSATIRYNPTEGGGTLQCALDFGAWFTCVSNPVELTGLTDGNHNYVFRVVDAAGNLGAGSQVSWLVDTVAPAAPTVTRTSPATQPTTQTTATISYSASESGGTLQCKLDGATYPTCQSSPVSLSGLGLGSHTFSVTQTDAAGNVSAADSTTWSIIPDTTPPDAPTVTRTSPTVSPTTSTSQALTFVAAESGGTLKCKLDGAAYGGCPSSPLTLNALGNGSHTYSVTQTDASGNVSAAGSVTWIVDTIAPAAPTVTRTSPSASPTQSTSQTITYSGEAGGTFQCKLDSELFAPCPSSPVVLPSLTNTSHTFSVTQTDAAGNVSSVSTLGWTVDNIAPAAPTVTRTSPTANPTVSSSQTISYSGEAGGTLQCKVDSAAFSPCASSPATLTGFSDGPHSIAVTQTDAAGNIGPATTVSWTVDITAPAPPSVTRSSPTANPTTFTAQTITYSGEAGGTFQCKLDSDLYSPCPSSPLTLNGLSGGPHTYVVTQTDAAGNVSAAGSVSWTIGTGPVQPTVTRTSPTASPTNSNAQGIAYSGTAGNSFQCKLDGAAYAPCPASPMTLNNLPEGAHTFSVTQTDAESNVSPAGSVSWTVDTLDPGAPTVTRTAPTATPTNSTTQSLSFSGAEAGGSFQCKLDSAAYSPCPSSPLTLNGLPDGSHTYSVTQTDAAGNVGPAGTASWTTDLVGPAAPTVTRTAPSASPTTSDSQTVVYAGEPGGTFECQLDSEPIEICEAGPLTFTGLSLGYHSFLVRQTDDAGNLGAVGVTAWTITTVPPDPTGPSGPIDPTGSTGPPPPDPDPPVVPTATLSSVTPKSIVPARTGGPFSLKSRGSAGSFRVKLSAASAVSVRLERVVAGGTRAAAGWTKLKLKSGQTTIYLSGRANGRALPAGIYKVRLTVGGAKPNVLGKSFRIKR